MQKDFAKFCKKSDATISEWISGKSNPHAQDLIKIANYLDIVSDIFPDYIKVNRLLVPEGSPVQNTEEIDYIHYLEIKWEKKKLEEEVKRLRKNENSFSESLIKMNEVLDHLRSEIKDIRSEIDGIKKDINKQ